MEAAFNMSAIFCCNCGVEFHVPTRFFRVLRADSKRHFYCPNGHRQHFRESEADKLRRDLLQAKQANAMWRDYCEKSEREAEAARRSAAARKGVITRMKKRASAGVCPCCERTFQNLQNHMKSKHPKFLAEEVA